MKKSLTLFMTLRNTTDCRYLKSAKKFDLIYFEVNYRLTKMTL